jgi:hypothetical protein
MDPPSSTCPEVNIGKAHALNRALSEAYVAAVAASLYTRAIYSVLLSKTLVPCWMHAITVHSWPSTTISNP